MSKYVMVDTVSMFRMRYCVEVPDDVGEELHFVDGTRTFPCTPEEYAKDTVTCEDAKEFTQEHLEEVIVSTREVTLEEAIAQYRKDEPVLGAAWSDEIIIKNAITPIGHSEKLAIQQEEAAWEENNERMDVIGQNGNDGLHYDEVDQ
jgi:hypothetical protein